MGDDVDGTVLAFSKDGDHGHQIIYQPRAGGLVLISSPVIVAENPSWKYKNE